jgi:hypothetical protein
MLQLAQKRSDAQDSLPLLRLSPEIEVSGPFLPRQVGDERTTPYINACEVVLAQKDDPMDPFGVPPMGWMPRRDLHHVFRALDKEHKTRGLGADHAHL